MLLMLLMLPFPCCGEEASSWQTLAVARVLRNGVLACRDTLQSGVPAQSSANWGHAERGHAFQAVAFLEVKESAEIGQAAQSNCRQKAANHKILAFWKIQLTASYFFLRGAQA